MKDAEAPTLGRRAPWLIYTNADLLQAPPGAQPNWRSLHDKVVVVEFLCTWSSDCVAEIPALNRLADSLDTSKVQFIAVDEDNPGYLQAYLAKHPITGWIIPDSSRLNGRSWGVGPLPTIFVIDTEGNVVLMTLHPEHIRRDALLTLANGENVALESDADAKADAETWQAIKDAQQAQARYDSTAEPRFSISITPGPPAAYPGSPGAVAHGGNQFVSVSGATPDNLLIYTFGIQPDQVKINGALPKTGYNLSLRAPSLDDPRLVPVVDQAIEFNCGVKIERHTSTQDVYVLKAMDHARLQQGLELPHGLGGQYSYTFGSMRLEFSDAGPGIMAEGLEQVLNRPVVNESGVEGNVTAILTFPATDFDAVRSALEKSTGFTLIPAKRPIESITITPNPLSSPPSANPIQ
jgi:thiol-disulfide isomerase/thioredoxin